MTTVQQLIDFLHTFPNPDDEVVVMARMMSASRVEGDVATWVELNFDQLVYEPPRPGISRDMEKGDAPGVVHWMVPPLGGRLYLGEDR